MKIRIFIILSLLFIGSLQGDYNPKLSEELWKASSAAYQDASNLKGMNCGQACNELKGYKFSHQFNSKLSKDESVSYSVFVNPDQHKIIFAFRGTDGNTQLMHEVTQSRAATYNLHNIPNAVATEYFYNKYKDNLRGDFLNQVKTLSQQYPSSDFYFTGHSLGGALTTLGALDASMSHIVPKDKIHLYTYGSPRVGDVNLAQAINNNVGDNYRVVHQKDIVPHVPPCITDFHGGCAPWKNHINENHLPIWNAYHTGNEVYYDDDKNPNHYRICAKPEDPTCSNQHRLLQLNVADHGKYLGSSTESHPHPLVSKPTSPIHLTSLQHTIGNLTNHPALLSHHISAPIIHSHNQTHHSPHLRPHSSQNQTHKPHSPPHTSIQTTTHNSSHSHIPPHTSTHHIPPHSSVHHTPPHTSTHHNPHHSSLHNTTHHTPTKTNIPVHNSHMAPSKASTNTHSYAVPHSPIHTPTTHHQPQKPAKTQTHSSFHTQTKTPASHSVNPMAHTSTHTTPKVSNHGPMKAPTHTIYHPVTHVPAKISAHHAPKAQVHSVPQTKTTPHTSFRPSRSPKLIKH